MTMQDISPTDLRTSFKSTVNVRQALRRAIRGGSTRDVRRLPRYFWFFVLGLTIIWVPINTYLKTAPPAFDSHMSLILPGSGSASSVNLANIGQASSHASSAFASNAVSPTETYKRLLAADRVIRDAASRLGITAREFGKPRVQLVDQTAFIHVQMTATDPVAAQSRNAALLDAFFEEIDRLRSDEMLSREDGSVNAIQDYRDSVSATRHEIEMLRAETGLHSSEQYNRQVDEVDELRARIETATSEYESKVASVQRLEDRLGADADTASRILRLNGDTAYIALVEAMADAAAELAEARSKYGDRHPKVVKAASATESARSKAASRAEELTGDARALERSVDGGRAALLTELVRQESERVGLLAELDDMRSLLEAQTARLERLAPKAARLEDLQRDFNVAEAIFASAIARTQSKKTDVYASYPLVQVLEDPTFPEDQASPRKKLAFAAGGAATFMLLFALSLGWIRSWVIERLVSEKQ